MRQITTDFNCQTTPGSCLHCISGLLFSLKRVKPIITARKIPKIDNNYWNSYNNFVSHFVCCWWPTVNRRKSDGQGQSTVNHQSVFGETEFGQLMVKSDFGGWLNCCQMLVKFGLNVVVMSEWSDRSEWTCSSCDSEHEDGERRQVGLNQWM